MSEVSVRELHQDTAGVLARVQRGEEIDVTEQGVVIAQLVPAPAHPLADLIAAGTLHPPTRNGPVPRPTGPVRGGSNVLQQMRDNERY